MESKLRGYGGLIGDGSLGGATDGSDCVEEVRTYYKRRIVELEQQLADERLAFDHANEVIGKLEADIAALSWTRITLENLPKMGDMVLIFDGDYCVDNVLQPFANGKKNQLKGWKNIGASHRRPINPPTPSGAKGETKP